MIADPTLGTFAGGGRHPLERPVRAFVATGSGLDASLVIPGNDKGPRPPDPYASVLLASDVRRGYPEVEEDTDIIRTPMAAVWSLQFYRAGAVARAGRFAAWLESDPGIVAAAEAGFSVLVPVVVNRLDEIVGDAHEERTQIDLTVWWLYSRVQNADMLDRVRVDVDIDADPAYMETLTNG